MVSVMSHNLLYVRIYVLVVTTKYNIVLPVAFVL